jgi:hypothetical protein
LSGEANHPSVLLFLLIHSFFLLIGDADIMLIMVDKAIRLPMNVQVSTSATWDDLVQACHPVAQVHTDANILKRFPKFAAGYDFKDAEGHEGLNMDDNTRIYAHLLGQAEPDHPQSQPQNLIPVKVTYWNLGLDRKYIAWGRHVMISPNEAEAEIIAIWNRDVRTCVAVKEKWKEIARNMCLNPENYEWLLEQDFKWRERVLIEFRDLHRSSTRPKTSGAGTNACDSSIDPDQYGSIPRANPGNPGNQPGTSEGPVEGHHAPAYDPSTRMSSGIVDLTLEADGQTTIAAGDGGSTEEQIQRISGNLMNKNLFGYCYARVDSGEGYLGRTCKDAS